MSTNPAFFLVPCNDAAFRAVVDWSNKSRRRLLVQEKVQLEALRIEFASAAARVTLGRRGADIHLSGGVESSISDIHCSFACEKQTGAIVVTDHSGGLTKVFDIDEDLAIPISRAQHSVVVSKSFNRGISIGSSSGNGAGSFYQFKLLWESDIINRYLASDTNLLTLGPWGAKGGKYRYIQGEVIGTGACGHVSKAVDLRDGTALAVKRFFALEGKGREFASREIRTMIEIQKSKHGGHEHILNVLDVVVDCQKRWIEMFMPLKEGSVRSLVGQLGHSPALLSLVARGVYRQMLQALRCIERHGIIHRDLKPDNILYESKYDCDGGLGYHFYLADFGLSHEAAEVCTKVGTETFMAPEALSKGKQTAKMDIWSLFATIVWILDAGKFRTHIRARRITDIVTRLTEIADMPQFEKIRQMAAIHPDRRPSPQELIVLGLDTALGPPDVLDNTAMSCPWLNDPKLSRPPSDAHRAEDENSNPGLQSSSFDSDATSVSTLPSSLATPDSPPTAERLLDCFPADIDCLSPHRESSPKSHPENEKQDTNPASSESTATTDLGAPRWQFLPVI